MRLASRILLVLAALASSLFAASDNGTPILGVIVQRPELMTTEHWKAIVNLGAVPEIWLSPVGSDVKESFDFTNFEDQLETFVKNGVPRVKISLSPHIRTIPWRPQLDEDGVSYTDRQNPFDPDFLAEWDRFIQEFSAKYGGDPRIMRVYIAPPSYFGEAEYYMGPNWFDLKMLCYGDLARVRFTEWLSRRYGDPQTVSADWGQEISTWESIPMPKRVRDREFLHVSNDWLDLTEWRTEYLTDLLSHRLHLLAEKYHGQKAIKCSVGDYSAVWATDLAALISCCSDIPNLVLHMTNGHSISDLKYAASVRNRYGVARLVAENDGQRFSRTEIAKIVLNCLLSGVDEFHFSQFGHLVGSMPGYRMTDSGRALADAGTVLRQYDVEPPRNPIAFLHSNTTCRVRAPHYRNRDVSHVYDVALSNGAHPDTRAFDWARYLHFPDVTGERLILDGDLEGLRMLIIPNTGKTVLPSAVYNKILDWVEAGGVLVVFGADGFAYRLVDSPPSPGESRCIRGKGWEFPPVGVSSKPFAPSRPDITQWFRRRFADRPPSPVWEKPLPPDWEAGFVDEAGHSALATRRIESGQILLFPAPVPEDRKSPVDVYYAQSVPLLLRHVAEHEGVEFPFTLYEAEKKERGIVTPLAISYVGQDKESGRHLFIGGAYDESAARIRFVPNPKLSGPARILLVDMHGVRAGAESPSAKVDVRSSRPSQYDLYRDPTNLEPHSLSLIPVTEIDFELPETLILALAPEP